MLARARRLQTSSQYGFASLTAAQDIAYVTAQAKPALATYLAAGGLKPVVVEASLGGALRLLLPRFMPMTCIGCHSDAVDSMLTLRARRLCRKPRSTCDSIV